MNFQLKRLSAFLQKYISRLREVDINLVFQVITSTVAFSAFLAAFNYFTSKAEVEVTITRWGNVIYEPNRIREFYDEYGFKIPPQLRPALVQSQEESLQVAFNSVDWNDHQQILKRLNNDSTDVLDGITKIRIKELEKTIGEQRVRWSVTGSGQGGWTEKQFQEILSRMKTLKISDRDYYIFLCAGINRRTISQQVIVDNTGDLDLREFELMLYAPYSRITRSRSGNIVSIQDVGLDVLLRTPVYETIDSQSNTLSFHEFRKGKSVPLVVTTRENRLSSADIDYRFKKQNVFDKHALWLNTFLIGFVMVFLTWFFQAKGQKKA